MIVGYKETQAPKEKKSLLFGEMLVSKRLLTHRQLREALTEQRHHQGRLGEILLKLKMLDDENIASALAEHLSMEYLCLDDIDKLDMATARILPENLAKRFGLIAVGQENDKIIIAMSDPINIVAIDTIRLKINRHIKTVVSSPARIRKAIDIIYHGSDVEEQRLRDLVEVEVAAQDDDELIIKKEIAEADISDEVAATKAPVIRFVNLLLSQAVKSRASDIHIEPQEKTMTIRMRIDGVLRDMVPPARKMQAAVTTRIKILASMDIADRRLPQDGRFKIKAPGRDIDVRTSVIPTIYGEKAVLRILDSSAVDHNLDHLGFAPTPLQEFKTILKQPHGIIIVTGPTGSGKSTTLYSALNQLKDPGLNITTVEDPVEYRLEGINQIQVKPEINLDFASCLRAILRQDPDIILIGEIRDKETVEIAIKASLTGHLVLSTFHTNDAPSAISRLVYMGIEPYLLASTLNLIVAQRLVRKICPHCKEPFEISDFSLKRLGISPQQAEKASFSHGKGCKHCGGTGYLGRLPIFEFLIIDNDIRKKLINRDAESEIRKLSQQKGYGGLFESGVSKIIEGLTTAEEVLKVTFAENINIDD